LALPPVYREAIVLCDLGEFDYAGAAAVMQCPIGTVRIATIAGAGIAGGETDGRGARDSRRKTMNQRTTT
jgi:hypothetical protein